eukprot:s4389_g4.t1
MAGTVSDPMDLDAQERLFWMQAGPLKREPEEGRSSAPNEREMTKRQRLDTQNKGKGKGKSSKGKSKGFPKTGPPSLTAAAPNGAWRGDYTGGFGEQMNGPWHPTPASHPATEYDSEWMTHRVNTLAQLVLRQEQTLASLRQDLVIYLFVRSGKEGMGKSKGFPKTGPPSLTAAASNGAWRGDYTGGFGEQMNGPWHPTPASHPATEYDSEWMTHRVNTLAQLVLRQEQTLASLRQDLVIYLFVRSGKEGMVPVLCEAADKWRAMKEAEPDKLTYSLKLAMFKQLLISLHQRLSETIKDKAAMDRAASLNWVDERQHWRHLHWSPAQQRLEVDQSLRPIPTEDLLTQLVQVRKAVTEETLLRFKSVRKLSKEVTADWIQFQICVSLRPEGGAIWSTLNQWIGQASWHTLGCRMRRERPNYDNLTQQVWNQM